MTTTMMMTSWFASMSMCLALIAVVMGANQECVGEQCTNGVRVFVHVNGGNQTGSEPLLHETVVASDRIDVLASRWALALRLTDDKSIAAQARVFDATGRQVQQQQHYSAVDGIRNDAHWFVLLPGEHWVWPGLYVGYRVVLPDVLGVDSAPIVLTTLALSPRLFQVDGFLSAAEADDFIALARPRMSRAAVAESRGDSSSDVRTSDNCWLERHLSPSVAAVHQRAEGVTRVADSSLYELFQVVHYTGQQRYESHYDYFPPELYPDEAGSMFRLGEQRMATLFFYLNDVAEGGETIFPKADVPGSFRDAETLDYKDCTRGIVVKPQRGKAVLWYNVLAAGHLDGARDVYSLHGACPVRTPGGEKWGANLWLRNKRVSLPELEAEHERVRERRAAAARPPVIVDDVVVESAPYSEKFPADAVPHGFRFESRVDQDGVPFVQVLRATSRWLDPALDRVTIRAYLNGESTTYARMSVSRTSNKYDFGELPDVLPVALGVAVPDAPNEPCTHPSPFTIHDANGLKLKTTAHLSDDFRVYVVEHGELWKLPGVRVGHATSVNKTIGVVTLAVAPNLFRIDNMVTARDVAALVDAAAPLLEPASEAGVGGPAGTPHAQLHRDGFVAGGRLDEKIARLARVSIDTVGTSWLAWRVGANDVPSFIVPASGSISNNFNGQRAATFFVFGGNSSLVFPLAGAASHETKLAPNSVAGTFCRAQQSNALRVDVLDGQAYLLYHLHSLHVPSAPQIDERAAFVACAQAHGVRWVFEKPIYLHTPRPVRALGVGAVRPAYEVAQAEGAYEPVPLEGELASAPVAKVSVYRVGGGNSGARPWRFALPQSNDTAALEAFLRVAAVKLAFASGESDVDASKYRAFNDDGFALKHTQRIADGDTLYVAPKTWLWVWPSNEVGHKREVKKVPGTNAAGEPALISFTMETLGVWPRVFVVRNFLSAADVKWLYDRSNQTINSPMNPSAAPTAPHEPSTTWLFVTEEQDEVEQIEKRVAALLRIAHSEEQFEALVVERYMQKQHRNNMEAYFDVERGTFGHMPMLQFGVNRLVGVYMLLKEPTSGGEIVFPNPSEGATSNAANPCAADAKGGIRPKLRVGDALIYYTLHADQQLAPVPRVDRRSIHWHCEVTGGEKWGAFKFAHNRLDPTAGKVGESVKGKKPSGGAAAAAGGATTSQE